MINMPKFIYNKLVRDNIPGWHIAEGHDVDGRQLAGDELKRALVRKLHEESDEVPIKRDADQDVKEEIADVMQALYDLMLVYELSFDEIELIRKNKLSKKGGFSQGEYVESIYMPTEDKWVEYCRQDPSKYPEIKD